MADQTLDNTHIFEKYDPNDMLGSIREMPSLCQSAWKASDQFNFPPGYENVNKIVLLGMGGSAIGGDLVSNLIAEETSVPFTICRSYRIPAFVDENTLVIASSYSGNTEETLSSFELALETGAKNLVITTGGKLRKMAEENSVPVFTFDYKSQPRAALPFSLLPIIRFLQNLGIIRDKSTDVDEAIQIMHELLRKIDISVPLLQNPAKKMAESLHDKLTIIYGAGIITEVAHRWKTQINENSKAWCFYEIFPELNHNAVVGYQYPPDMAGKTIIVMLDSALLPKRIRLRYSITRKIMKKAGVPYQVIEGKGNHPLSQVMSLILFGDFVSYYLAILYRVDPSPVNMIDFLKSELAKR